MDNLAAHKNGAIRNAIEAADAELRYLRPIPQTSIPIENAFAKFKAILRKAAARTLNDLWDAIAVALPSFSPAECANYFAAAGYGAT